MAWSDAYIQVRVDGKAQYLHRIVWTEANGPIPKGHHIDHINGDIHDNSLSNLRLSTHAENLANSRISKRNSSGFKGLSWKENVGKWEGRVSVNRKTHRIHGDMLEVVAWIIRARVQLHGDFARIR